MSPRTATSHKRRLAEHPWVTSLTGALIFGAVGALLADARDVLWVWGTSLGLALGGAVGWAFSMDHREPVPTGVTRTLYAAAVLLAVAVLLVMTATR